MTIVVMALNSTDFQQDKSLADALNVFKSCGGWGKEIKNMQDYETVKEHCYLTFRQNVLCCIEKPDCPEDLEPEIPIIPYMLFPIKHLELGCVEKEKSHVSTRPKVDVVVCYDQKKKKT